MKAHGRVMTGYRMRFPHPPRKTLRRSTNRVFTRRNVTVAAVSVLALLLFGLMIWGFYESIETLKSVEFPSDLTLYLF
jgi:hypothetical protein